jgi:hypothetical protein
MPDIQVFQDPLDDAGIFDKADNAKAAAAFEASQRIIKIHLANQARPGATAEAAVAVIFGLRYRCIQNPYLKPPILM